MNYLSLSFLVYLALSFFLILIISADQASKREHFGSNGPFIELEKVVEISTKRFFNEYVKTKRALLIKGATNHSPAFRFWSDKYLIDESSSYNDYKIVVETVKKESRDQNILSLSLKEFLMQYQSKDIYMVNEVPFYLRKDVVLPQPLQCGQALSTLEETIMWFSSGGTKSVVHTDDYENILCMFDGTKELILVDYYKHKKEVDVI